MDEMLIQLLLGLVELVFEVLLQFAGEAVLDLLARAAVDVFKPAETPHSVRIFFACGFLGAVAGAGSLVIFPRPLFHPSKIHGVSLIISPVLTGLGMSAFGALLRRRGKQVVQIESFPYAFAFGTAVVRLVYVS